jgi:hypothetical protein
MGPPVGASGLLVWSNQALVCLAERENVAER